MKYSISDDLNIGYKSPITRIMRDIQTQIIQDGENQVFQAVQNCDVIVNREELIKALQYDRGQYEKGYKDGAIEELEKIKRKQILRLNEGFDFGIAEALNIIDEELSELKGKKNESV